MDTNGAALGLDMNYKKLAELRALIASESANDTKTDEEVLTWLTEEVVEVSKNEKQTIVDLMAEHPLDADAILDTLEAAAANEKKILRRLEALHPRAPGLDMSNPVAVAFVTGDLVTGNILTAEEAAKLRSIGFKMISRAEEAKIHGVELIYVTKARA